MEVGALLQGSIMLIVIVLLLILIASLLAMILVRSTHSSTSHLASLTKIEDVLKKMKGK